LARKSFVPGGYTWWTIENFYPSEFDEVVGVRISPYFFQASVNLVHRSWNTLRAPSVQRIQVRGNG
jgi:hypothetical protein